MPYKLYLDKQEDFLCEVSVKNASLKGSIARLIMETSDGINYVFNGKIDGDKCIVPIRRMKGLLDENTTGKMSLEIIVEDTYFSPWKDEFVIEEHTSVKVKVAENTKPSKPIVEVKSPSNVKKSKITEDKSNNLSIPLNEISKLCTRFGINRRNLITKKSELRRIVNEYFKMNPEFNSKKSVILSGLRTFLK